MRYWFTAPVSLQQDLLREFLRGPSLPTILADTMEQEEVQMAIPARQICLVVQSMGSVDLRMSTASAQLVANLPLGIVLRLQWEL